MVLPVSSNRGALLSVHTFVMSETLLCSGLIFNFFLYFFNFKMNISGFGAAVQDVMSCDIFESILPCCMFRGSLYVFVKSFIFFFKHTPRFLCVFGLSSVGVNLKEVGVSLPLSSSA